MKDGRIQCDLCPRYCRLREGQRGLCFVRANGGNGLVLTNWGRTSGFCIDPIEKKPLSHFLPGTSILSFGSAGCNLNCKFCQNWDISKAREMDRLSEVATPEQIADSAISHGCRSVAMTYNDPVIYLEYAVEIAKACRSKGLKTVAVSAGYITEEARKEFFDAFDATNIDLKAFTQNFYHKLCGGDLDPVLETLVYIRKQTSVWLEITTLIIPGQNDSHEELQALCSWIYNNLGSDIPLHFSAFHPDWKMMDIAHTPASTLYKAQKIAFETGLNYVYIGNIVSIEGTNTYCHTCKKLLINRTHHAFEIWNLDKNGACSFCGSIIPGYFEEKPGHWNGQIQRVTV